MVETAELTDENFNNNKRKWQIALRRYLIEEKPSTFYAPYFGLSVELFRKWIECQFTEGATWSNFGKKWKFEHFVPSEFFDLSNSDDLRLYWNFLNIRVELVNELQTGNTNIFSAESFFEEIFQKTGLDIAKKMVDHLNSFSKFKADLSKQHTFLNNYSSNIKAISKLDSDMLLRLNQGEKLDSLILELEILSKFGR